MNNRELERLIRNQDWIYENAGTCWQDGMILGNGNIGTVGYAPYGLEWVLNKGDIFDGRVRRQEFVPHAEVVRRFLKGKHRTLSFLNEDEAHDPGTSEPLSKSAATLKIRWGDQYVWAATRPHKVKQRLSLWEGELYYDLDLHLSHPRLKSIVPRDRNLFCVQLQNSGTALWNHTVELVRPFDEDLASPRWQSGSGLVTMEQTMPHCDAHYAIAVLVVPTGSARKDDPFLHSIAPRYRQTKSSVGDGTYSQFQGQIPQNGNADIFLSIYTSYEADDPLGAATQEVRQAAQQGFRTIERENQKWWRKFWNRGVADFGEHKDIQRYWTFSLYETACLLGKAPVPGLYGLWYGPTETPRSGIGSSWYTHDQNVQIPMMPIFPLNRADLVVPFAETYLNVLPTLIEQTKKTFDRSGAYLPLTMNQLGRQTEGGAGRYSIHGGVYSGVILAWAWWYTQDEKTLTEKLYPLLREFVRFYYDAMALGKDGHYHLDWEIPPEIMSLSRDTTSTLALFKSCLSTLIDASKHLDCDQEERIRWQYLLDRFPSYPKKKNGMWWSGIDIPEDHYCQTAYLLYPFFPACESGDEIEKTAALTLLKSPESDIEISFADTQGRSHAKRAWAWFFPTIVRLRLGQRSEGWDSLYECLRIFAKPNGLFSHNPIIEADPQESERNLGLIPSHKLRHTDDSLSPASEFYCHDSGPAATLNPNVRRLVTPVAEGSGAFLFAATETLLQSHSGLIRIFPGIPKLFTGEFVRLLAQGAFEVSAKMIRGQVIFCHIKSLKGGNARLRNPWTKKSTILEKELKPKETWKLSSKTSN